MEHWGTLARNTLRLSVLSWTDEIYATVHRLANMGDYQSLRMPQSEEVMSRCIHDASTLGRLPDRTRQVKAHTHAT